MRLKFGAFLFALVLLLNLPTQASAQVLGTFIPGSGGTAGAGLAWDTAANWSTDPAFPNAATDTATFNVSAAMFVSLNVPITVNSLTVNNSVAAIMTLQNGTAGTLTFANGGAECSLILNGTSATTNNLTMASAIILTDTLRVTSNNVIAQGALTSSPITFTAAMTGAGGFIKDGPGRMSFVTTTKAFTGAMVINLGRIRVTGTGRATAASSTTVNAGGQLGLDYGTATGAQTWGAPGSLLTINGLGESAAVLGALRYDSSGGASIQLTNPVALGSDAAIHVNTSTSTLSLDGGLTGSSLFIKTGAGTVALTAAQLGLTGGTRIVYGTITVASISQLGTGSLTMFQELTRSPVVTLNNLEQLIGDLSTQWNDVSGTRSQTLNLNGTALTINQTGNTVFGNGAVATLTGVIAGTGSVTMSPTSTGILNLTGPNTYSGGTTVNAGTLHVNNPFGSSGTGTGNVVVAAPAVIAGGGFIVPDAINSVTVNGTLSPGNGTGNIGIVSFGSLVTPTTLTINGTLESEIVHPDADGVAVNGSVVLGPTSVLNLPATNSYDAATTYNLVGYDGTLTGTFGSVTNLPGTHMVDYSTPNLIVLTPVPVPEPSTLLVFAALALVARRRIAC